AGVLALLQRQAYRCALTGWDLTPETAALDHIIPVSRGGEHRISNAQVLTKIVNRAKGTLTNEEFIELCGAVWRHHRRSQPSDGAETPQLSARTAETSDVQPSLFSPQN
ncbi:MAG: hypothetical protein IT442_14725, partial [Phycisphaeraceae bacterium]|nr:hypothetical protein [Phycisphaeraceae bacterium]